MKKLFVLLFVLIVTAVLTIFVHVHTENRINETIAMTIIDETISAFVFGFIVSMISFLFFICDPKINEGEEDRKAIRVFLSEFAVSLCFFYILRSSIGHNIISWFASFT